MYVISVPFRLLYLLFIQSGFQANEKIDSSTGQQAPLLDKSVGKVDFWCFAHFEEHVVERIQRVVSARYELERGSAVVDIVEGNVNMLVLVHLLPFRSRSELIQRTVAVGIALLSLLLLSPSIGFFLHQRKTDDIKLQSM